MTTLSELNRFAGSGCRFSLDFSYGTWSCAISRHGDYTEVNVRGTSGDSIEEAYNNAVAQLDRLVKGAPELAPPALEYRPEPEMTTEEAEQHIAVEEMFSNYREDDDKDEIPF